MNDVRYFENYCDLDNYIYDKLRGNMENIRHNKGNKCCLGTNTYMHIGGKMWCEGCSSVIIHDEECPKCGDRLIRYKHHFGKIWCPNCGFVIREDGEKRRVFCPPKGFAVKKYMLKVAIQILKNEGEEDSYASCVLKERLRAIEAVPIDGKDGCL